MSLTSVRKTLYRQLDPAAWPRKGLSPLNFAIVILIIIAVVEAVVDTEPTITRGTEPILDRVEFGIGLIFLLEYSARLWIAVDIPKYKSARFPRLRYAASPMAIIDILAVVPALFAFGGAPSLLLRFFRILRMLRLAKLGRMSNAWDHIREAFLERLDEFALILGLLAITVLISGSLMYFAEADAQPEKFGSIPRALWWAIVTVTTVGYGDTYPVTGLGRVLGGLIAVVGVLMVALPTGIFAASFTEGLARRNRKKLEERSGADE
ncbi:MAG: ion transporter [Sphingomicrobium sp.]